MSFGLMSQPTARLEFEVASVKPNSSVDSGTQWNVSHGNFAAENASLKQLIAWAYAIPKIQVSGPTWLDSLRFDIKAKGIVGASDSQVFLMLQKLLNERFHLQVHSESREMMVALLMVARSGLKILPIDSANPMPFSPLPAGRWSVLQMTGSLQEFAGGLSSSIQRPVLDRTGTEGKFRFRIYYNNGPDSEGPDLYAALREQLGLRLEQGKASVRILVVDGSEKIPTEN